jgi:hypothetical protein
MIGQDPGPADLMTDKLKSYPALHRQVLLGVNYITEPYANYRAEISHESTRR